MSRTMPDSLNVEELLFAATPTQDMNSSSAFTDERARASGGPPRRDNVGCIYMQQNKLAEAEAQFTKANSITDNPHQYEQFGRVRTLEGRSQEKPRNCIRRLAPLVGGGTIRASST
ncbi:MAG: hypothetical protein IPG10_16115, partial [Flavobacteriales bacterium]|nr:hypothetical protein [Flavobacteriales bacterium]